MVLILVPHSLKRRQWHSVDGNYWTFFILLHGKKLLRRFAASDSHETWKKRLSLESSEQWVKKYKLFCWKIHFDDQFPRYIKLCRFVAFVRLLIALFIVLCMEKTFDGLWVGNFLCFSLHFLAQLRHVFVNSDDHSEFLWIAKNLVNTWKIVNFWKFTSIESPGVLCHSQTAYPGMHNIDERAVNHPKACAHHGNS